MSVSHLVCAWCAAQLLKLHQEDCSVADYSLSFCMLADRSGWNDQSLFTVYPRGLKPEIRSELACRDDKLTLNQLITLPVRLDNLLRTRGLLRTRSCLSGEHLQTLLPQEPMERGSVRDGTPCVCTVGDLAIFKQHVLTVLHPKSLDSLPW